MNDTGEFQDEESNFGGRLSHVSSQPAIIPSSRSVLSRDKRLHLNTWKSSGLQENVFGNQFSTLINPEIILKELILAKYKEKVVQFQKLQGQIFFHRR